MEMEYYEVRVVGGIESCFVSLPLPLIQTLQQSTRSGRPLPPVLPLELRSPTNSNALWHVAWSGSASTSSSAIEIAQEFAECIGLLDHTSVQVRAVPNPPKATLVTIEPHSEDDWEVLELNADHAEAAILKQVSIVHEALRFPLWLHGRTIITFVVTSTIPRNPVVQLVPGTEVAVAPKRRKKNVDSHKGSSLQSSNKENSGVKALLRVQDPGNRLIHKYEVNDMELSVVLTSVVLIHPETAKQLSLNSCQYIVIVPKLPSRESVKNHEPDTQGKKSAINRGTLTDNDCRQAIVRLLYSDSVAEGHVMVSQSLRIYLRAGLHSWVHMKSCTGNLKKDIPSLSLSPCLFKMFGKNKVLENKGLEVLDSPKNRKTNNLLRKTYSDIEKGTIDWSSHERVVAALSNESPVNNVEKVFTKFNNRNGLQRLLSAWYFAQHDAIASIAGVEVNSLVLGNETLLHFEVKGYKFGMQEKIQVSSNGSMEIEKGSGEPSISILYVLSTSEESLHGAKVNAYELSFDEGNKTNDNLRGLELLLEKLHLGDGVYFHSVREKTFTDLDLTISSLSWMGTAATDVINRLTVLLSPASGRLFGAYDLPFPGHVLIYGPPGSGKTLLATAVAKSIEEHEDILAHIVFVSCTKLALEKSSTIRLALSGYISEALDHTPSVVVFDDLDSIISSSSDSEGSPPSSVVALTELLTEIIDECEEKRRSACGIGPIALIATAQSLTSIPQSLSSSGRFDFHVQLPTPAASERGALLKHEIRKRSLICSDDVLSDVASKCDGFDAYDLEILVDRAIHAAIGRFLTCDLAFGDYGRPALVRDDFTQAMHEFLPVAMRDITKPASEGGRSGWEDVGGLIDIRTAIKEMIELPSKFPNIFAQAPLRLRSNVLLYGPPGCGKTHIVGAAAAACSLRFISVKGPELLNKYIGASEQAVRDIFSKATAAAPCLLFFDEFDSIAPKRGHDNTGVTDRVVNQFLTELDGVEVLTGVFVFAATRPDLLDAALLRPGRLDRLLFCDFPSQHERLDILTVLSRKLPVADDSDFDAIARMTEGFSGADLQALLSDAQLAAVHDLLGSADSDQPGKMPIIDNQLLKSVAAKARPSVSEAEKQRLYGIYSQFLDSKRSVAAQSRDTKGKRATLA